MARFNVIGHAFRISVAEQLSYELLRQIPLQTTFSIWIGPNGVRALVKLVRFCRSRQGAWRGNGPIGETEGVRLFGLYANRKRRRIFRFRSVGFGH